MGSKRPEFRVCAFTIWGVGFTVSVQRSGEGCCLQDDRARCFFSKVMGYTIVKRYAPEL